MLNEMRGRRESLALWPVTVVFDGRVLVGEGRPTCMEFSNIEGAEAFFADIGMEAAGPRILGHVLAYEGCGGRARISFVPACVLAEYRAGDVLDALEAGADCFETLGG